VRLGHAPVKVTQPSTH